MNEKELQDLIVEYLRTIGALVIRVNGGRKGNVSFFRWWGSVFSGSRTSGVADILFCYKGRFGGIEVKNPNGQGRSSRSQAEFSTSVIDAGGYAVVANGLTPVMRLTDHMDSVA